MNSPPHPSSTSSTPSPSLVATLATRFESAAAAASTSAANTIAPAASLSSAQPQSSLSSHAVSSSLSSSTQFSPSQISGQTMASQASSASTPLTSLPPPSTSSSLSSSTAAVTASSNSAATPPQSANAQTPSSSPSTPASAPTATATATPTPTPAAPTPTGAKAEYTMRVKPLITASMNDSARERMSATPVTEIRGETRTHIYQASKGSLQASNAATTASAAPFAASSSSFSTSATGAASAQASNISSPPSSTAASASASASASAPVPVPVPANLLTSPGGQMATVIEELKDEDFVTIKAEPSDKRFENDIVYVQVSRSDAQFNLQPIHCGRSVVFLNAQDPRFYRRELRSPSLSVWILSNMSISESHALKRMYESGWRQNIQVKVMEVNKFELVASKDGLENVLYEGNMVELPDAVFVRVGANVGYFGLAVIRQLEQMGCLMFNPLKSIEISRDKMLTLQHLAAHGLPIPKTVLAKFPIELDLIKREFEYPIIIKKASGSQGKGIIKVDTHNQLQDLVDMLDTGKPLLFQEYISASAGKDLRVFVVGGRVVGAMMRIAAKGNFKANVHQGGTVKPVKLSAQVEWLVLETVRIIGLDVAGVDLLIDKNTYKICEVNSSPGFEGLERALGENIAIKMFLYMKMRLGVWRRSTKGQARMGITVPVEAEHLNARLEDGMPDVESGEGSINKKSKNQNANAQQVQQTPQQQQQQQPAQQQPQPTQPAVADGSQLNGEVEKKNGVNSA